MSLRFARANLALWHVLQEKIKLIFQGIPFDYRKEKS